ncbi:hypothetical protein YY29_002719 [Salmonella enterica subsp. enterica]|nr:hypothetical protein [Salmonella enterica subsp. enterica]EDV9435649.1 hypothetical protein [Salmonella enterica subsp. enterica]
MPFYFPPVFALRSNNHTSGAVPLLRNANKKTAPRKEKGPQGKGSLRVIAPARKGPKRLKGIKG